jgi:hypothetical protein
LKEFEDKDIGDINMSKSESSDFLNDKTMARQWLRWRKILCKSLTLKLKPKCFRSMMTWIKIIYGIWKSFDQYKVSDDDYEFVNECDLALKILNKIRNKLLLHSKQIYQDDNYNMKLIFLLLTPIMDLFWIVIINESILWT